MARSFVAQSSYAAVDLSPYKEVSIAFWLNWTAYANDDALALEYGISGTGGGFYLDPNSSTGVIEFRVFNGGTNQGGTYARSGAPAAQWNHWLINVDRVTSDWNIFVNGTRLSAMAGLGTSIAGTAFTNEYLNVMCRTGGLLKATGKMAHLTVWNTMFGPIGGGGGGWGIARALYNGANPSSIAPDAILGYWPMDDSYPYTTAGYTMSRNMAPKQRSAAKSDAGDFTSQSVVIPDGDFLVQSDPVKGVGYVDPLPLQMLRPGAVTRGAVVNSSPKTGASVPQFTDATGSQYYTVADNAAFTMGGAVSFAAWLNVNGDSSLQSIFTDLKESVTEYTFDFRLNYTAPNMFLSVSDASTSAGGTSGAVDSTTPIPLRRWFHAGIVRTGSQALFYHNGVLVDTQSLTATGGDRSNPFYIGRCGGTSGGIGVRAFIGSLQRMGVWSRVLTQAEIQMHMQGFTPINNQLMVDFTNQQPIDLSVNRFPITIGGHPLRNWNMDKFEYNMSTIVAGGQSQIAPVALLSGGSYYG